MTFKYSLILVAALALSGCQSNTKKNDRTTAKAGSETYEATLTPLNASVTGSQTKGNAKFVIANDTMKVTINVTGAPANMEHWQHFHGFADGKDAQVVTMADDKNKDGIIDVTETADKSGTTMVPFNQFPALMEIGSDTYPKADANGSYSYTSKIPMAQLAKIFAEKFNGQKIDLDKRVLYIHGVPTSTKLPATVASLGDIPAQVTIPIAVGKIVKVTK